MARNDVEVAAQWMAGVPPGGVDAVLHEATIGTAYLKTGFGHNIGLQARSASDEHGHSTVTAQSQHSHSTVTAQSQYQALISIR